MVTTGTDWQEQICKIRSHLAENQESYSFHETDPVLREELASLLAESPAVSIKVTEITAHGGFDGMYYIQKHAFGSWMRMQIADTFIGGIVFTIMSQFQKNPSAQEKSANEVLVDVVEEVLKDESKAKRHFNQSPYSSHRNNRFFGGLDG